jgi:GDPmannose 4,6-dehydratase
MNKKALITGITGQDGSYLAEFLLKKGYEVHGIKRKSSSFNTSRIDHLYEDSHKKNVRFFLHYGDVTDGNSIRNLISQILPDEIYNLAAQSHVDISFKLPEYTCEVNAMGTLRILEAIRSVKKKIKFYQASTSELFGDTKYVPQNEATPFSPSSPYAISKMFSYWITKNYRDAYGIFACNGILFNHESERRGETFVTKKITRGLARIFLGLDKCLYVGNLESKRDWGHAKDFVEMQWKMLQMRKPRDFVISTDKQYSVREFIEMCCKYLGIEIRWEGNKYNEKGYVEKIFNKKFKIKKNQLIIQVDKKYFRPKEVPNLLGDSTNAKKLLGWKPRIFINKLIKQMIDYDLKKASEEVILRNAR